MFVIVKYCIIDSNRNHNNDNSNSNSNKHNGIRIDSSSIFLFIFSLPKKPPAQDRIVYLLLKMIKRSDKIPYPLKI